MAEQAEHTLVEATTVEQAKHATKQNVAAPKEPGQEATVHQKVKLRLKAKSAQAWAELSLFPLCRPHNYETEWHWAVHSGRLKTPVVDLTEQRLPLLAELTSA